MRAAFRSLILTLGLCLGGVASAQTTFIWTGLGEATNVLVAENWQGNVAPSGSPTDNLEFPAIPLTAYIQLYPTLQSPLTVGSLTFNFPNGFYTLTGGALLTLNGDITTYSYTSIQAPVELTAGNHVFHTEVNGDANAYGNLYLYGALTGEGGITKTGDGFLSVASGSNNTYTGGTILDEGSIWVGGSHPLGFGTVTVNSGTIVAQATGAYLPNDFVFGAHTTFIASLDDGSFTLGNADGSTITPAAGVDVVQFNLIGTSPLYLDGDMQDGEASTTYVFSGLSMGYSWYHLEAFNSYTGGTVVNSGASVIFETASSLPESGEVMIDLGGYAGVGTSGISPATFLSRIAPIGTLGTIGFDNGLVVTDDLDLSLLNYGVSLGTRSTATLTGLITPAADSDYFFTSGGRLYLTGSNPLADSRMLTAQSLFLGDNPGMLVLGQSVSNTYSGGTVANAAAVVFDQPGALPASGDLTLSNGGYFGFTETSGLTVEDIASRITTQVGDPGVIGLDTHANIFSYGFDPATYSANIDLGGLSNPVYLGTSGAMTITGSVFTTDDGTDDYYFTGYGGGQLTVASLLTGSRAVHIGLPSDMNTYSSVTLTNTPNDFTGGIVLNSGVLFAPDTSALGTGPITVDAQNADYRASLVAGGSVDNNISILSGNTLEVVPYASSMALTGTISGAGELSSQSLEGALITINGNNTYSGGSHFGDLATVIAGSNAALGTGTVTLTEGAHVHFTTTAPVVGPLLEGSAYVNDIDGYYQQDAAIIVGGGGLTSTLTINQDDYWGTFNGSILEDGTTLTVVLNGTSDGKLELNGENYDGNNPYPVYSGGTVINGGVLVAGSDTALGTGAITLNGASASLKTLPGVTLTNSISFGANGGILSGKGTFDTPITAGTNVVIAPGASPGILTFNAGLTLAPGGSLQFEVQFANGGAGVGYDLVSISAGVLDITASSGSPFTISVTSLDVFSNSGDVADFSPNANYSWMVFEGNSGGGITGFAANKFVLDLSAFTNDVAGGSFSLSQGFNGGNPAIFLNFTAVPEPSTYALLALGLGATVVARRRRR